MYRFRQISHFVFFFLAFLLYCSPTCLAAGHVHATVSSAPVASSQGAAHTPCHSTPKQIPDQCLDCSDHVFLSPASAGAEMVAASRALLFSVCLPILLTLGLFPQPSASVLQRDRTILSPPRYLTLSVLRL